MKKIAVLVSILFSFSSYACSLAPSTEQFIIDDSLKRTIPLEPTFKVSRLSRGKKALHSCSGLASLSLKLDKPVAVVQGYSFEIVKGTFKKIRFSDTPITLSKFMNNNDEFIFHYYEITNEPIDIILKITAVSKSGEKSKPQFLKIQDKVSKKSLWPSWSQRSQ